VARLQVGDGGSQVGKEGERLILSDACCDVDSIDDNVK
jgi:hypothetical protein